MEEKGNTFSQTMDKYTEGVDSMTDQVIAWFEKHRIAKWIIIAGALILVWKMLKRK